MITIRDPGILLLITGILGHSRTIHKEIIAMLTAYGLIVGAAFIYAISFPIKSPGTLVGFSQKSLRFEK